MCGEQILLPPCNKAEIFSLPKKQEMTCKTMASATNSLFKIRDKRILTDLIMSQ